MSQNHSIADQLREEIVRLKSAVDDARAEVSEESEAKANLQRQHETLVSQWRLALEQREREMEELQDRLNPPRDLELLRSQVRQARRRTLNSVAFVVATPSAQIAEEMSASHAANVASLQAEAESFRSALFEMQVCLAVA